MSSEEIRHVLDCAAVYLQRAEYDHFFPLLLRAILLMKKEQASTADLRILLNILLRDTAEDVRLHAEDTGLLEYIPGREGELLVEIRWLWENYHYAVQTEEYAHAIARKKRIDETLAKGKSLLEEGKSAEAEIWFQEAVNNCLNENRIFLQIGRAFMNAGDISRALCYMKQGMMAAPEDTVMTKYFWRCITQAGITVE